jgi:hypothetical protein
MTTSSPLPRALALLVALCCASFFAVATPRSSSQDERSKFRDEYKKLAAIEATDEMGKLIQKNLDLAVEWVIEVSEAIAEEASDELANQLTILRLGWKAGVSTDFVDQMERYFSLLEGNDKKERKRLRDDYDRGSARYYKAIEVPGGNTGEFTEVSAIFESIAALFEQFGDKYYASQSWSFFANCNDEYYRKTESDLYKACRGYGKVVELRAAIGLKDDVYATNKARYEVLKSQGFAGEAGEAGSPGASAGAPAPVVAGTAVTAALTFEAVEDLEAVERPCYYIDELYPMWNSISMAAKGSSTDFPRLPDAPRVLRPGANEVELDLDKDGKGDLKIPITGNLETVQFDIGKDDEKRRWAFLAVVGIQKDTYQGFEMNLLPDDNQFVLFTAPCASMGGTLAGTPVRVFDDNMDGIYGSLPATYLHVGCTEGSFAPEMDSIQVAGEKRARPWSEYQEIGGSWYKIVQEKGGTSLSATPATVKTGKLKLKFKGPVKPTWVVVKGGATYENSYFDVAGAGPQGVTVPAGRYTLYYGELRSGKKKQMIKTLILPGRNTPTWAVPEGGEATVELGGPFGFDFRLQKTNESIKVIGNTVVVVGATSERYERPWGCVARPEAAYRKKGSKKGGKAEKMDVIQTQEEVSQLGWAASWFPRDLDIPKKSDEAEVEVQLTEKANKMFGKVESIWKE